MADITYPYIPANGSALNVGSWNTDIHSTVAGASLYGELNGHVQDANYEASQKLQAYHFKPGEIHRGCYDGELTTRDFYDALFSTSAALGGQEWLTVAGCSTRTYQPWATTASFCSVSCFATNLRMRETTNPTPPAEVAGGPEMYIVMSIDGVKQMHTLRSFPYTNYPINNPGDADAILSREIRAPQHYDLVSLTTLTKGWHEVRLEVLIQKTQDVENIYPLYFDHTNKQQHFARHRIRFGIRKAQIVSF